MYKVEKDHKFCQEVKIIRLSTYLLCGPTAAVVFIWIDSFWQAQYLTESGGSTAEEITARYVATLGQTCLHRAGARVARWGGIYGPIWQHGRLQQKPSGDQPTAASELRDDRALQSAARPVGLAARGANQRHGP